MWCVPRIDEEFVARMEDVLRLYARPFNRSRPVIALDEKPVVLRSAARTGVAMMPGCIAKTDYEYVRRGTANIFCIVEPLTGRRLTHATATRKGTDFAQALRKIARRYRRAKKIHLVMDNLSTHAQSCVIAALGSARGRALWARFELHFTPKHASWLNVAEMEASLVSRECLGRRKFEDITMLQREVREWNAIADENRRSIAWKFRVHDARRVFRYDGITSTRAGH